ncbi:MAG: response regulator [Chloroflexi bacterium]|nr:response regulator [Chloroflexota bacterium]
MKKILIVDDEPHIMNLLKLLLDSEFYLIEATDGLEAMEKIDREKPDLVLLDLIMPKMDGYKVCQKLKENPLTKNIKIIVLSARCQKAEIKVALDYGADAYVTKPFDPFRLTNKLKSFLNTS